jgi:dTMP kinase
MPRGKLVTIEGLDGAGKTTLAESLAREIDTRGTHVEVLREPGGAPASERIRELVKDPALALDGAAEALLYAAARAQLVQESLQPLLAAGALVLLDRFVDSSLAYQGAGRKLGVGWIRAINQFATALTPDLTLLLSVSPATGRARSVGRTRQSDGATSPDRMERESEAFFARVAGAYEDLARAEPRRFRTIDAERAPAEVLADALAAVEELLGTH